jgi:hypothetical protein
MVYEECFQAFLQPGMTRARDLGFGLPVGFGLSCGFASTPIAAIPVQYGQAERERIKMYAILTGLCHLLTHLTPDQKVSLLEAVASSISALFALVALFLSAVTVSLTKRTFLRQSAFNLDEVWPTVRLIDPAHPSTDDVIKASRALSLTAACWNYEVVDKNIIHLLRYETFSEVYESLSGCTAEIPGLKGRTGASLLTADIRSAYSEMKVFHPKKRNRLLARIPGLG